EELRTLCLDLGVDYDSLRGEGKAHKARELVLYLGRQRQFDRLLAALSRGRPASFDLDTGPAALEALYATLPAFEVHDAPPRQQTDGHHVAQADRGGTAVVGDDNVIGDGNVVIRQQTGDDAVQIGQARDVTIHRYASPPSGPKAPSAYTPPPLPDPETLPDPGPLPPGSRLPFGRNALFTGRVAPLLDLARTLLHDQEAGTMPVARSIQGMGGVGKTQLAVEFAYRYGRFFDGVHWLNAARPEDLGDEVARCGVEMNLPNWPHERPEQVARTLREWQQGGRRLVVLDNLEKVDAAREWLGRLSGGTVRVLLTARRGAWPRDLGLKPLRLDVFSPRESRAFLREYVDQERATDDELDALGKRLGHLPLALELAGRYLERRRLTVEAYVERLEGVLEHRSMKDWRRDMGSPTGHDLDLAASFALSWEQVKDGAARRLFVLCGHCAPNQAIPPELLQRAAGLDEDACDEALGILAELGLLEWKEPQAGPTIHPLLAEYARAQETASESLPVLATALAPLARAAEEQMDQSGRPSHFEPLLPHVRLVAEAAGEEEPEAAASLWSSLGYYLNRVADYAGARNVYERALAIRRQVLGERHPDTAQSLNNLGYLLQAMGDLEEAQPYLEGALAIFREVLGERHPDTARSLNNLGYLLQTMGDLERARPHYEEALAIFREALGENHPDTARSLNNLGYLLQAVGDLEGARPYYEGALAIQREVLGEQHPETSRSLNNIGVLLQAMGDLEGARPYYEGALAIRWKVLDKRHPAVAASLNSIGYLLQAMGDLERARPYFEGALAIRHEVLGKQHPDTARSLNNLGALLQAIGDLKRARPCFEGALAIRREVLGERHPDTAQSLNNLGALLRAMGDLEGARSCFEEALATFEQCLPPEHPYIGVVRGNLESLSRGT
ncbi:MAG: FxSxx-COOH system tetratricopeptide repeat protein, partial [Anaerolineae bacterium]